MSETQKEKAAAMHEATDIGTLIERVEAATGPDREIDIALWRMFDGGAPEPKVPLPWLACYTENVDHAINLLGRVLPKWSLRLSYGEGLRYPCVTMGRSYPTNLTTAVEHHTAPLAICLGVLRSLQEKSHG